MAADTTAPQSTKKQPDIKLGRNAALKCRNATTAQKIAPPMAPSIVLRRTERGVASGLRLLRKTPVFFRGLGSMAVILLIMSPEYIFFVFHA
jgi:hypothetical protein